MIHVLPTMHEEHHRARALAEFCADPNDSSYWSGRVRGLVSEAQEGDAILGAIGSQDLGRDAYGRGYRDGRVRAERGDL